MISFAIDPFKLLFEACNELYPDLNVEVFFVPTDIIIEILKDNNSNASTAHGVALDCKDGVSVIYVNSDIHAYETIEIISSQVASLVAKDDEEQADLQRERIRDKYADLIEVATIKLEEKLMAQH